MELPSKFAFRFGDEPQWLHHAQKTEENVYSIIWDSDFYAAHGAQWFECTTEEIVDFVAQELGWVIEQ